MAVGELFESAPCFDVFDDWLSRQRAERHDMCPSSARQVPPKVRQVSAANSEIYCMAFFSTSLGLGTLHYAALACPFSQRDAACARVAVGGRLACAYCDMWRLEFSVRQRRLPPVAQNPLKSTSTTSTPGRSSFQQPAQCAHPHTLTPQGSSLQPLGAFHHFVPLASLTHGCVPRATAVAPQL